MHALRRSYILKPQVAENAVHNAWVVLNSSSGLPTYYFSLRPYSEAQTTHPINDKIVYEKKKVNYYHNNGFQPDELETAKYISKPTKKQAPRPPVRTEDKVEVLKIQQELEKLDEMLEAVDNNLSNTSQRKLSTGGVSIVSDIAQCEESVVAVVHRDNVVTPAESGIPPFSSISLNSPASLSPPETLQNVDVLNDNREDGSVDSPLPPDTPSPNHGGSDDEKTDDSVNQISPTPTPPPSLSNSPLSRAEDSPPPPPMPPVDSEDASNRAFGAPRLTSSNLNSVLLRPTKRPENKESKGFEPGDDNLRVKSAKTKAFMENLDGKLRRITVLPSYVPSYAVINPKNEVIPSQRAKNENVIEDSINRNDAKEMFASFVNSRVEKKDKVDKNNEKNSEENKIQVPPLPDENLNTEKDVRGDDFITHKKRMNNVFRSIHLPEVSKNTAKSSTRNFKSLGQINDDKTKHRQAMNEIFKNIELRRKDSFM